MKNPKLAAKIIKMARLDQKTRKSHLSSNQSNEVKRVDKQNLKHMKNIIRKFGWPTIDLVGKRASHLAWLLVQHGDSDVKFQVHCLRLMKTAMAANSQSVPKANIAYLTDRILINKHQPQIYGTQFHKNSNNQLTLLPTREINTLNQRRKSMGLIDVETYRKELKKIYRSLN